MPLIVAFAERVGPENQEVAEAIVRYFNDRVNLVYVIQFSLHMSKGKLSGRNSVPFFEVSQSLVAHICFY